MKCVETKLEELGMYSKPLPVGCRYDEASYASRKDVGELNESCLECMTSENGEMWKRAWDNTYTLGKLQYVEVPT